jgi:hypothetical protein
MNTDTLFIAIATVQNDDGQTWETPIQTLITAFPSHTAACDYFGKRGDEFAAWFADIGLEMVSLRVTRYIAVESKPATQEGN